MLRFKQTSSFAVVILSILLSLSASCQVAKVTVVVTNPKNDLCLLKLNQDSDYLDDTVYLSNENIGILNVRATDKLYGSLFEFITIDKKGKHSIVREYNSEIADTSGFYYQHGMFTGRNGTSFLLMLFGSKPYLDSMSTNFDVDSEYFEDKLRKGVAFKLE